jgi:hypothetical protein
MLGPIRLEGPDLAASGWRTAVARLLRADPPDQINIHFYPATACPRASQATPKLLLSKHASVDLISQLSWLLTAARAVHRPAVISETNSASCGGKPGVSNSPVASIWAVRFVEAALLAGFEQVRFHTAGTSYDAFVFNPNGTVTRRPLATALSFIHRWIPVASRITSTVTNPQIFAATITHHGTTSMIVTSFANHTLDLPIAVAGARKRLTTDTLTTRTTIEVPSSLQVVAHQAQLRLAPNTVVAFKTR